jgi:ABC-type nitrate/sulfonate/bicarbonate transport system ATPase subunit
MPMTVDRGTETTGSTSPLPAERRVELSICRVTKSFQIRRDESITTVSDVSFDVLENVLCVPFGSSGRGKATVLRIVAGLEEPTEGRLMDGPFGALDAETPWSMQKLLMNNMGSSRTTVLTARHDIQAALPLADRIVFMTRHPRRVRENLLTELKQGRRIPDKEKVIMLDGFTELEQHVMHMMRGDSPGRDDFLEAGQDP